MSESIHALRSLLRAIRQRISPKSQNSMWHDYVVAGYRRHAGETDASKLQQLSQLVEDYTNLVHDVRHEKELLLSYNIGVDRDVRQRKMVQSTAARVGLRLPTTDDGQEGYGEVQEGYAEHDKRKNAAKS